MPTTTARFIEPRYRILFWPLLLSFLTFGASMTIVGALLPKILTSFHWSYTSAGIVLAANAIGYPPAAMLAGVLIKRFGPRLVLFTGLGLLAVSLYFFGALPSVPYNLALNFFIGIGQGLIEVVVNYLIVRMERGHQSHLMSFMHAAFSVGAIGGPTVVAVILSQGIQWQVVYHLASVLALAVAVVTVALPFSRIAKGPDEDSEEGSLRLMIKRPMLLLASALLFLYVGLEVGITNWVSEYFVKIFSTPVATGAFMVSIFWFGIFTGRLLLPIVYRGPRQAESLLSLGLLYTGSLLGALLMPSPVSAGIFFYLTSLGCSAIYPLVMTLLGRHFERGQSVAVGFAATGGGVGAFIFPFLMSAISQHVGLRPGFVLYLAMGAVLTLLAYLIMLRTRQRRPA